MRSEPIKQADLQPSQRGSCQRVRSQRGAVQVRASGRHAQPRAKRLQHLLPAAVRCASKGVRGMLQDPGFIYYLCLVSHALSACSTSMTAETLGAKSSQDIRSRSCSIVAQHVMHTYVGKLLTTEDAFVCRALEQRAAACTKACMPLCHRRVQGHRDAAPGRSPGPAARLAPRSPAPRPLRGGALAARPADSCPPPARHTARALSMYA